jgi:hypothetical protein
LVISDIRVGLVFTEITTASLMDVEEALNGGVGGEVGDRA